MIKIQRYRQLPYLDTEMFDLVNDIEAYPDFLPGCTGSRVIFKSEKQIDAELTLSASRFSQSFITQNYLQRPNRIDLKLVEGPFKYLNGVWLFVQDPSQTGCCVELQLNFEFSRRRWEIIFSGIIPLLTENLLNAFEQRAHRCYGKKGVFI
jgi:ribosome-associated toxin RatA of RatAB toxin-antitoxin module